MTDKEFKRLNRSQLIEIIYQLQLQEEVLKEENTRLRSALAEKRLRIDQAGSIAQAAVEINGVMLSAQTAAEQYLNEIELMREEVEKERQHIVQRTLAEAAAIIAHTKRVCKYQEPDEQA